MVEHGMGQFITDPCVRMVVDGKAELILAVHIADIVIIGSNETCRGFRLALVTKSPTKNLGELTWYTAWAFKHDWGLGTLYIRSRHLLRAC